MTPEIDMVVSPYFDINPRMNVDLAATLDGDALFSAEIDAARSELDGRIGCRYLQAGAAVLELQGASLDGDLECLAFGRREGQGAASPVATEFHLKVTDLCLEGGARRGLSLGKFEDGVLLR